MGQEDAMESTLAIGGATVIAALIGGTYFVTQVYQPADAFAACRAGQVAGGDIGGPFTLVDETGATVTDADVITQPSILYFGYTFCPDVCPLDNARNADAVDLLAAKGISATPIFITIDPARDTPEIMADYTDNFSDTMIGLTGSAEQIAAASTAYRTYYAKQEGDPEFYMMDHSTFSYLVLPELGFMDFFQRDDTAEQVAERTACFVNAAAQ
jgi:protein SCO1